VFGRASKYSLFDPCKEVGAGGQSQELPAPMSNLCLAAPSYLCCGIQAYKGAEKPWAELSAVDGVPSRPGSLLCPNLQSVPATTIGHRP
jgi:hypothetical protein